MGSYPKSVIADKRFSIKGLRVPLNTRLPGEMAAGRRNPGRRTSARQFRRTRVKRGPDPAPDVQSGRPGQSISFSENGGIGSFGIQGDDWVGYVKARASTKTAPARNFKHPKDLNCRYTFRIGT